VICAWAAGAARNIANTAAVTLAKRQNTFLSISLSYLSVFELVFFAKRRPALGRRSTA
jgi:hypothetical protein